MAPTAQKAETQLAAEMAVTLEKAPTERMPPKAAMVRTDLTAPKRRTEPMRHWRLKRR